MLMSRLSTALIRSRELHFDLVHGVTTMGVVDLRELNLNTRNNLQGRSYEGIDPRMFRRMFSQIGGDYRGFTFVDFGSGKGRAVLLASELPFKRIVGVEFSTELCAIAERNIRNYRGRQACSNIELVNSDAAQYPITAEPTVFYFYSAFGDDVLSKVLASIRDSVERFPRDVIFLYTYPEPEPPFHSLIEQHNFKAKERAPWWIAYRYTTAAN
jgi:SAM-dependent methyltransferase